MSKDIVSIDEISSSLSEFSRPDQGALERLPEIKLAVQMTKFDVDIGNFFTVDKSEDPQNPKIEVIGKEVRCIVLFDTMEMDRFSEDHQRELSTTEFETYNDMVFVFQNEAGLGDQLIAALPYSGADPSLSLLRKNDMAFSKLKFHHNIYVMLTDGSLAVFKNTARGMRGTNKEGEVLGFSDCADDSYMKIKARAKEVMNGVTCGHVWNFTAVKVIEGEKEVRPAFALEKVIDKDLIPLVKDAMKKAMSFVNERRTRRVSYCLKRTLDINGIITATPQMLQQLKAEKAKMDGKPIDVEPITPDIVQEVFDTPPPEESKKKD